MRIVRGRADARWLPSRFNFAVFRLYAYLRLLAARPQPQPGLMLSVERYQSAAENYIVCVAMMVVIASMFDSLVAGIVAAILAPQLAIVLSRGVMRIFRAADQPTIEGASRLLLTVIIAAAAYAARTSLVARVFLGIVVLDAIAAAVMFALRGSVARLERQFE